MAAKSTGASLSSQLIKGAGEVAQSEGLGKLTAANAASQIGSFVGAQVKGVLDKKIQTGKEYDAFVQDIVNNGTSLSDSEYEDLYDQLQEGRDNYIFGSKKEKAMLTKNLNEQSKNYADYKVFVEDVATLAGDDVNGLSAEFKSSEQGKLFLDAVSGKNKLTMDPNRGPDSKNEIGVMNEDGEWQSLSALKQIAQDNTVDSTTRTNINSYAENIRNKYSKLQQGQTIPFNEQSIRQDIDTFLSGAKKKSVAYDPMFGNTSFKDDLVEGLLSDKYYREFEGLDPTPETSITPEDAELISRTLINDPQYENFYNTEIQNYIYKFFEQQKVAGENEQIMLSEGFIKSGSGVVTKDQDFNPDQSSYNSTVK